MDNASSACNTNWCVTDKNERTCLERELLPWKSYTLTGKSDNEQKQENNPAGHPFEIY